MSITTMKADSASGVPAGINYSHQLSRAWQELCDRYLPVAPASSAWRYSRAPNPGDPEQGWKLHVSATLLNANTVLERVAPFLAGCGVRFKAPASLQELGRINSGLRHGYSQVGKVITVYPGTTEEAVALAHNLHELTRSMPAPIIPFDLRFRPDSNVYYRYGAFKRLEMETPDGLRIPAIRDPQGNLVPDLRESAVARPAWVENPFIGQSQQQNAPSSESPLSATYRVFRALTQRGKGGVYQAVDLSAQPPRLCLLKEGRRHGELSWDGRDGYWRIQQEEWALEHLQASGVAVPRVYASFDLDDNRYLVIEFIEGESLQALLNRRRRRMSISSALRYGIEIASIISCIHSAGWVWRDCKPSNLMLTANGRLRPVDFEGACPIDQPDPPAWVTPAFTPPKGRAESEAGSTVDDDLYALGAVIYLLLAGRLPEGSGPTPLERLRRRVPATAREVVTELLTAPPRQKPGARTVARRLKAALSLLETSPKK